ncbi:hypothetical protein M378DRAFT_160963 [Amanita muscaria Koide BX008]|uniref:Uncharacterized protein n=1 Tax=Amanita muscaria (strain Koide BX008) TaxID=946122 RepID=A0A0C2WXG1_AMAMK|nr:hypothetical protein M378DRAFT_160963 [Amanita muscaria Koide BX008]
MHPMFEAGVTRIIEEQLVEDGLLSREDIEPAAPSAYSPDMTVGTPEAQHWIGELAGIVATLLPLALRGTPPLGPGQAAHSLDPTTGPPEAQHWIGTVVSVLGVILPIVMNGVPPPSGRAAYAVDHSVQRLPLQVQHGILSKLAELLKHPLLISTVKEVAEQL